MPIFDPVIFDPAIFDAGSVVDAFYVNGVDVWDYIDRARYEPASEDLGGLINQVTIPLVDVDGSIPIVPEYGMEIALWVSGALKFGGWISQPLEDPPTGVRQWLLPCQSWGARLAETPTGSLNKSGVIGTDRSFLIEAIIDGLQARSFGSDSIGIDDPILVANEAVNWEGIQETTQIVGTDWSYKQTLDVVQDILSRAPGVSLRIRPDKIVESGLPNEEAPFVLAGMPTFARMDPAHVAEIVAGSYAEERITAGHFNRVRLGGAGAAEVVAYDQVSHGRFRRVLDRPYENDEDIPAGSLEREAYARLERAPVRRVARATITDDGLHVGQRIPVCVDELGAFEDFGAFFDTFGFTVPSTHDEPTDAYRGEFVVQRITPTFIGPGVHSYELELGDYLPELDRALSEKIGETAETV